MAVANRTGSGRKTVRFSIDEARKPEKSGLAPLSNTWSPYPSPKVASIDSAPFVTENLVFATRPREHPEPVGRPVINGAGTPRDCCNRFTEQITARLTPREPPHSTNLGASTTAGNHDKVITANPVLKRLSTDTCPLVEFLNEEKAAAEKASPETLEGKIGLVEKLFQNGSRSAAVDASSAVQKHVLSNGSPSSMIQDAPTMDTNVKSTAESRSEGSAAENGKGTLRVLHLNDHVYTVGGTRANNERQWFAVGTPPATPDDSGLSVYQIQRRETPDNSASQTADARTESVKFIPNSRGTTSPNARPSSDLRGGMATFFSKSSSQNLYDGSAPVRRTSDVLNLETMTFESDRSQESSMADMSRACQQVDSTGSATALRNSIKFFDEGLGHLRISYEKELENLRIEIDGLRRGRSQLEMQLCKVNSQLAESERRLLSEVDKSKEMADKVNDAQSEVLQAEQRAILARSELDSVQHSTGKLQRTHSRLVRQQQAAQRSYETEVIQRKAAEDRVHQLEQTLEFEKRVAEQERSDLRRHLEDATSSIIQFEATARQGNQRYTGSTVNGMQVPESDTFRTALEELKAVNQRLQQQLESQADQVNVFREKAQTAAIHRLKVEELLAEETQLRTDLNEFLAHRLRVLLDLVDGRTDGITLTDAARLALRDELGALAAVFNGSESGNSTRNQSPPVEAAENQSQTTVNQSTIEYIEPLQPVANGYDHPPPRQIRSQPVGPVQQRGQKPVGPIRCRSAPVAFIVPTNQSQLTGSSRGQGDDLAGHGSLGQGRDYFKTLFGQEKRDVPQFCPPSISGDLPQSVMGDLPREAGDLSAPSIQHEYITCSSSSVCDVRVLEVQPGGQFIRIINTSTKQDYELGNHLLQQNQRGHPVAMFRFPAKAGLLTGEAVTVWARGSDQARHSPPTDFIFKDHSKWSTDPQISTILCTPDGQAIAWCSAVKKATNKGITKIPPVRQSTAESCSGGSTPTRPDSEQPGGQLGDRTMDPVGLRREKTSPARLIQTKSATMDGDFIDVSESTALFDGTRSATIRVNPIPGLPFAGAPAQRLGSSSLRRYQSAGNRGRFSVQA